MYMSRLHQWEAVSNCSSNNEMRRPRCCSVTTAVRHSSALVTHVSHQSTSTSNCALTSSSPSLTSLAANTSEHITGTTYETDTTSVCIYKSVKRSTKSNNLSIPLLLTQRTTDTADRYRDRRAKTLSLYIAGAFARPPPYINVTDGSTDGRRTDNATVALYRALQSIARLN